MIIGENIKHFFFKMHSEKWSEKSHLL
jgi:hypothetical protein